MILCSQNGLSTYHVVVTNILHHACKSYCQNVYENYKFHSSLFPFCYKSLLFMKLIAVVAVFSSRIVGESVDMSKLAHRVVLGDLDQLCCQFFDHQSGTRLMSCFFVPVSDVLWAYPKTKHRDIAAVSYS